MKIETHIIDNQTLLDEFISFVSANYSSSRLVAIDTETDSVQARTANLYGIGLAFEPDEGFYIPFRTKDGTSVWGREVEQRIASLLSTFPWKYLMHNGIYDIQVLRHNLGIDLVEALHCDTILLKHTLDEERPHGLKETAVKYLGPWADKAQEELYENIKLNGGSTTKTNLQMYKADTEVLARYCIWDTCLTRQLFDILEPKLDEENLRTLFYEDEVMPLYKEVTIPMTENGFPIDVEHFKSLQVGIQKEISDLEDLVQVAIEPHIESFCLDILNETFPVKRTGTFPKVLASQMGVVLPVSEKTGAVTLSKSAILKSLDPSHPYTQWLLEEKEDEVVTKHYLDVQLEMFFSKYPDRRYVFNLKSNDHLSTLLFGLLGETPIAETEGGSPKVDEDTLDMFKDKYQWVNSLVDMKKLNKLLSTYVEGVLDNHVNGVLYVSWKQFGTTSGRFSCTNINLQNLPRVKEDDSGLSNIVLKYTNQIKKGFIAPAGYKLVDADQSALEPRAFACAAEDEALQEVFTKGLDLYSSIAIKTFGAIEYSANKDDENYLGKHKKELRQLSKIFSLASVYGASANRLKTLMNMPVQEVQKIIDDYFNSYPKLKNYIKRCHEDAITKGKVVSRFGRVRHLPLAKTLYRTHGKAVIDLSIAKKTKLTEQYWIMKNLLNLSTNHPIQSTAAYIMNKAAVAISRKFKENGIDAYICAQVHDQITCIAREDQAKLAQDIVRDCMQNTVKLEIPFIAEPAIGNSWNETK